MSAQGRWFGATCGAELARDPIGRNSMLSEVRKSATSALSGQPVAMIVLFVEDGTESAVLGALVPTLDGEKHDPERDTAAGEESA